MIIYTPEVPITYTSDSSSHRTEKRWIWRQTILHVLVAELTSDDTATVIPTPDPECRSSSMPHNDRVVGHALYFYTYSTWEGKCLYIEDLCVREEYRSECVCVYNSCC